MIASIDGQKPVIHDEINTLIFCIINYFPNNYENVIKRHLELTSDEVNQRIIELLQNEYIEKNKDGLFTISKHGKIFLSKVGIYPHYQIQIDSNLPLKIVNIFLIIYLYNLIFNKNLIGKKKLGKLFFLSNISSKNLQSQLKNTRTKQFGNPDIKNNQIDDQTINDYYNKLFSIPRMPFGPFDPQINEILLELECRGIIESETITINNIKTIKYRLTNISHQYLSKFVSLSLDSFKDIYIATYQTLCFFGDLTGNQLEEICYESMPQLKTKRIGDRIEK